MTAGFESLRIYQLSLDGIVIIYKLIKKSPLNRDFALCDQIKRAVVSIALNIAEGYGRRSKKDFAQFVSISIGSCNEVYTILNVIGLVYPSIDVSKEKDYFDSLGKQIFSFRKSLRVN